jgi:hypothetical protein
MAASSKLFVTNVALQEVAEGKSVLARDAPEDAAFLIKIALLTLGFQLSDDAWSGGLGGAEAAVADFRASRGLAQGATIDQAALSRLDYELNYLEGNIEGSMLNDPLLLRRDPLMGAIIGRMVGMDIADVTLFEILKQATQLGNRFCFRISFILGSRVAGLVSTGVAEPLIFIDYCRKQGPCDVDIWMDQEASHMNYRQFLQAHNPGLRRIRQLSYLRRPDILRHKAETELYEIKAESEFGILTGGEQLFEIMTLYRAVGLPYVPGTRYRPTRSIPVVNLIGTGGEKLNVILEVLRPAPGFIVWSFCLEGDYLKYFQRVRMVAGLLAIILAIIELLPILLSAVRASSAAVAMAAETGRALETAEETARALKTTQEVAKAARVLDGASGLIRAGDSPATAQTLADVRAAVIELQRLAQRDAAVQTIEHLRPAP